METIGLVAINVTLACPHTAVQTLPLAGATVSRASRFGAAPHLQKTARDSVLVQKCV